VNLTERAQLRRLQRILQDPKTEDHEARMFANLAVGLILASYEGRRFMREFRAELGSVPTMRASVEAARTANGLPAVTPFHPTPCRCGGCESL